MELPLRHYHVVAPAADRDSELSRPCVQSDPHHQPRHLRSTGLALASKSIGVLIGYYRCICCGFSLGRVCRQSISDSWLGYLRECLAHLVLRFMLRLPADSGGVFARWFFV